jgi:hypothetical protein
LGGYGIALKAGELILAGSLSIMFPIAAGDSLRMSLGKTGSAGCSSPEVLAMPLPPATIQALADHLEAAELNAHDVVKITDKYPEMDFADAYAIQYAIRARKLARGVKLSGLKMGLTSFAKTKRMGVDVPIYGFLTDYFARPDGAANAVKELIHPKIEAEIAFVTKAPLRGPGCHIGDVLAATDFVIMERDDFKTVAAAVATTRRMASAQRWRRATALSGPRIKGTPPGSSRVRLAAGRSGPARRDDGQRGAAASGCQGPDGNACARTGRPRRSESPAAE